MATQKTVVEVDIQGTEKVESMRTQMRKLREELARLPEGTKEFQKVQRELGALTDKMGDLSKSVNTLSGDPLERLNNSFSMIGSSILSLDFGQAQTGLKGMTSAVKDFKFKDATTAIKGFSTTIFDLGKALLLNPLFSIPAAIVLLIQNLDNLTKMGGKVGAFFGAIKNQIDAVWNSVVAFLDATGIIDSKAEERKKKAEKDAKEAEAKQKKDNEKAKHEAEKLQHEKDRIAQEAAKKQAERMQKIKDDEKALTDFLKTENEKRYQNTLSAKDKELRQLQLEYDQKKRLAHGNTELLNELDSSYFAESIRIESKYSTASKDIKTANANESKKLKSDGLRTTIQFATDEELVEEESAQTREENLRNLYENRFKLAEASIGGLMGLNDALTAAGVLNAKQSFKVNKALQLAQAGVGAIQAVQVALADPTLVGPSRYIAAAAAGIAGAANVAKIAAMKFNAGTSSTSQPSPSLGGGSSSSMSAPAVDLSFLNQGSNKSQPVQAYVLATNVSSAQEAEQKIKDQSKIIK
jgi:hypothetical protein